MSIGEIHGRLTVLAVSVDRRTIVRCLCVCGTVITVAASELLRPPPKATQSCGCLRRERSSAVGRLTAVHGHTRGGKPSPEYVAWQAMRRRCAETWPKRHLYFDRGIRVCPEWESSFQSFLSSVGPRPGPRYTLDRRNNDKGYEPSNVRWADVETQRANQRPRGKYKPRVRSAL